VQDRAVSHRHIGILFHQHFRPPGHGSKPPITVMPRRLALANSDTSDHILRPPLWRATALMGQSFQNVEAVARSIGTVPLEGDFHIELH
jgi:hypothetical protein